ncbi:MAG: 2'-5' RNA ligase family protein [Chloroflexota bacterium]
MRYAIELFFDMALEHQILGIWDALGVAGFPALHSVATGSVRPHLTIAVFEVDSDSDLLVERTLSFGKACSRAEISFQSVGMFPTNEGVLFLAPTVTAELLALHARFYEYLADFSEHAAAYYKVNHWVPHSTMAVSLAPEALSDAMKIVLQNSSFPMMGHIAQIGVEQVKKDPLSVQLIASQEVL